MALAIETDLLPVAALACADAYSCHGSTIIIKDEPFVTVFSDGDTAEVVIEDAGSISAALPYIAGLSDSWDVVVVLPAALSGEGHRRLRGRFANVKLQLWWSEAGTVLFGRVEVP